MQISGNWDVYYSEIVLFAFYRPSRELVIIIEIMQLKRGVFIIICMHSRRVKNDGNNKIGQALLQKVVTILNILNSSSASMMGYPL